MAIKWIKYLPYLIGALLLAALLWLAYQQGFQTAYNEQQLVIEQAEKDHTAALLASSQALNAAHVGNCGIGTMKLRRA